MREAWYVPYQPTLLAAERVLVLAPHADDEVFGCGGSLALLAAQGAKVRTVIVSQGDQATTRQAESAAAAAILGYPTPEHWNFVDRGLEDTLPALTARVAAVLDEMRPTLLFAPSPWEMHPDHRAVCDAALQAAAHYAETAGQRIENAPLTIALYEIGLPLAVTDFIDITPFWAQKQQAMQCFASQLDEQRYAEQIAGLNVYRSYTLGKQVIAAEALHIIKAGVPAAWPPLPSQQDVALWRCEAAFKHAQAQQQDATENIQALEQALAQSQAESRAANTMLDTIYATRGWRWLTQLKRLLGRG